MTPHVVGKLDDKDFISDLKIVPEKVVVSGARRLIQHVSQAVVDIPVNQRNGDFAIMAPIHLYQADGTPVEGLEMTPWQSNVKVTIAHNAITKTVPLNLNVQGETAWKTVSVQPTAVVVKGEADTLKNIDTIDLPDIDIENMTEEKTWKVLIPPIDGVVMDPDEVDATLSIKKEE